VAHAVAVGATVGVSVGGGMLVGVSVGVGVLGGVCVGVATGAATVSRNCTCALPPVSVTTTQLGKSGLLV
jgi:hypothetical protein